MCIIFDFRQYNMHQSFLMNRSLFIKSREDDINDHYLINQKEELGRGSHGRVFVAESRTYRNRRWAVKIINKKRIKLPLTFFNEIEIMKKLDHPNIIKIYETFQDQDSYYIITDLCNGGELFDYISRSKSGFLQREARKYFIMMLDAVNYCHQQKVCHRDLKPQNFLIQKTNKGLVLKLIDFGLSMRWVQDMRKELKKKRQKKLVGTSYYIAPEIIKGSYDERCDIWSLGVILFILVTGIPPFSGQNDEEILQNVYKGNYTYPISEIKNISDELKDLLKKIFVPEHLRIVLPQIYHHPWIRAEIHDKPIKVNYGKMISFSKYSKFKKLSILSIASSLSEKDLQKMSELFKQIDINHDGFISTLELQKTLASQGRRTSFEETKKLIEIIDLDQNGKINYTEFVSSLLENSVIFRQQNLIASFKMLDENGDGKVSSKQLKKLLQNLNSEISCDIIDQIITSCDENHDGFIDFQQFVRSFATQ